MKKFVIILCLVLLSGCVIFKGNNVPKVESKDLKFSSDIKVKIFSRWDFDFLPISHSNLSYEDRERIFNEVLKESNCCELVKKESGVDIVLEGKSYDQRNPYGWIGWFISAITLHIIPSWHEAKIFVMADVKENKKTHHYEVKDSMTTAIWAPLIVATPFAYNVDKTQKEILENSYRTLLLQMKKDDLLEAKK
jgi:hypothetical protein